MNHPRSTCSFVKKALLKLSTHIHNRKNGKTTMLCLEMMMNWVCNLTQQAQLAALSKNITI